MDQSDLHSSKGDGSVSGMYSRVIKYVFGILLFMFYFGFVAYGSAIKAL